MTIYLDAKQVPASLRGSYTGKQFQVEVRESVTIPSDAGLWDGGSRSVYRGMEIASGNSVSFPGQQAAPWDQSRSDRKVDLKPGFAVVCERMFSGKDMGWTFYLHPADAAPMQPAPIDLTAIERAVLEYTASRKSSYMGRDRCQMCQDDMRDAIRYGYRVPSHGLASVPTREEWDAAKVALIARGMLNKAGAITPAGRNANASKY